MNTVKYWIICVFAAPCLRAQTAGDCGIRAQRAGDGAKRGLMSKLLLLLILAAAPSWAINCSGLVVDEVTPHSLTVHLTTDTTMFYEKLRYGVPWVFSVRAATP